MLIGQVLPRIDNSMQICFHEFSDYVNIFVANFGLWGDEVSELYNVFVFEKF